MRIQYDGKVGIGTTSPNAPLEIHGGAGSGDEVLILSNSKDSSYTNIHALFIDGGAHYDVYNSSTIQTGKSTSNGENFHMNRYSDGDVCMCFGGGKVGIGDSTPSYRLDVSGTGRFTDTLNLTKSSDTGLSVTSNATIGGNLTVTGDLTVSGTTTTVNSTTVTVDDPIITLGGDTAPSNDDTKDRGVEFRYYSGSAKVGFMGWDNSAGSFVLLKDATNSSEVFSGTAAELKVGSLTIGSDTVSNLSSLLTTSSALSSLSNVHTATPSDNQVLTWDGTNNRWAPANASGGGASALNDLSDVSTSGAQSNYALVYNGSSWAPAAQSGSGGSSTEYYSAHIQNISDINQYTGYTITASSTLSANYPAEYAFTNVDLGTDSVWLSANSKYSSGSYTGSESTNGYNGEWIQINFGKKVKVHNYSITAQRLSNRHYRAPGGYKMFGSNDGSSWTEVHVGSAALSDYSGDYNKTNYNTLSTPSTYQYFRLVINSTAGSNTITSIVYLAFFGTFEEPDLVKGAISANVVHQRMTETATLTVPGQGTVEIEGLRLTITPQSSSSKVELNYSIFHEESNHNLGFAVSRTVGGTETFITSNHTSNGYADYTFMNTRDDDYGGSPKTITYSMIDEPNTSGVVVYKVYGKNRESGSQTYYINRTKDDTNDGFEHGISTSSVKEFSTFTHNIAEQKVQGRVLETIAGVCDGRSVSGSSGTYTLEEASGIQHVTSTSYVKTDGTGISYKPPPGTRQVIVTYGICITAGANNWKPLTTNTLKIGSSYITTQKQVYRCGLTQYGEEYKLY
jgi:hypothetical protein